MCIPPSHAIGRDKESRHLLQMKSHPAQNPGMEEQRKLSEYECVLKPNKPQPVSNMDIRSILGELYRIVPQKHDCS